MNRCDSIGPLGLHFPSPPLGRTEREDASSFVYLLRSVFFSSFFFSCFLSLSTCLHHIRPHFLLHFSLLSQVSTAVPARLHFPNWEKIPPSIAERHLDFTIIFSHVSSAALFAGWHDHQMPLGGDLWQIRAGEQRRQRERCIRAGKRQKKIGKNRNRSAQSASYSHAEESSKRGSRRRPV